MKRFMHEIIAFTAIGTLALGAGACQRASETVGPAVEEGRTRVEEGGKKMIEEGKQTGREITGGGGTEEPTTSPEMEQVRFERSDPALEWEVERALGGPDFSQYRKVDVKTQSGVVTLTGEVANEEHKQSAMQAARGVQGVQEVKDELRVREGMTPTRTVPDNRLKSQIQQKLTAENMTGIEAQVEGGVVTLSGQLDTYQQANSLMDSLKEVEGIKSVRTDLKIQEETQQQQ